MKDDVFTIRITGQNGSLPTNSTLLVLKSVVKMLRNINARMTDDNRANLEWSFDKISMNSPMVAGVYPEATYGSDIGKQTIIAGAQGLLAIQQDGGRIPQYFDAPTLRLAKGIVGTLRTGIQDIQVSTPYTQAFSLSNRISLNVIVATKDSYTDYGTLEGVLETASVGRSERFIINSRIYGNISCYFDGDLLEQVRNLWTKRVSVSGLTTYTKAGLPKSIQVRQIIGLRSKENLPQWEDLKDLHLALRDMDGRTGRIKVMHSYETKLKNKTGRLPGTDLKIIEPVPYTIVTPTLPFTEKELEIAKTD